MKIKANKISINCEISGHGRYLTLIHGAGSNLNMWYKQVPVFSQHYQVLTYDVAMTRARDFLYVLWPQCYYLRPLGFSEKHNYAQCSRFFTDEVMSTMEEVAVGQTPRHEDVSTTIGSKDDIARRIRYMWE